MLPTIVAAVVSFFATNIDDIVLLTFFFGQGIPGWRVVAGQYLGFSALVLVSLAGYLARLAVPEAWIGLLGLVPINIGASKLHSLQDSEYSQVAETSVPPRSSSQPRPSVTEATTSVSTFPCLLPQTCRVYF